jgi:hypothetical protein
MPPSVSNLSQKLIDARARLDPEDLARAEHPVWVDTRHVKGYFEALKLRDLCSEREDLGYLTKTVRNADQGEIPGFSFVREGEETLNDHFKKLSAASATASGAKAVSISADG